MLFQFGLPIPSLHVRRQELSQKRFKQLTRNNNCLRYLIPDMRDPSTTDRLRSANKFPVIFARTNRFKNSFMLRPRQLPVILYYARWQHKKMTDSFFIV